MATKKTAAKKTAAKKAAPAKKVSAPRKKAAAPASNTDVTSEKTTRRKYASDEVIPGHECAELAEAAMEKDLNACRKLSPGIPLGGLLHHLMAQLNTGKISPNDLP